MVEQVAVIVLALLLAACTTTRYVAVPLADTDTEIAKNQPWLKGIEPGDTLVLHTHEGKSYFFTLENVQFSEDAAGLIPQDRPSMVEIRQMEGRQKLQPVISPIDTPEERIELDAPWWTPAAVVGGVGILLLVL
jgi:hypothetical protein